MKARSTYIAEFVRRLSWVILLLAGYLLSGCSGNGIPPVPSQEPTAELPAVDESPYSSAEVAFNVRVPAGTEADAQVFVDLLDEVTGLALNPTRYPLQLVADKDYSVRVSVPVGSVLKYRYSRQGSIPAIEYNTLGQQVRYRLAYVNGPLVISDNVPAWMDMPYEEGTGRIIGSVVDRESGAPIPNLLISASGLTTFSTSDGSFVLEEVPVGTHNLVAYALDGAYAPFQQGAAVAADSTTPAQISVAKLPTVNVTFQVTPPPENIVGVPVRLAGNFYQTGNTFADLDGGINVIASRMPLLTQATDGKYTVRLTLPIGADFRYKYTLGDGFWNAEQTAEGAMHIRQLIVPQEDIVVDDIVASWKAGNFGPISIEVSVPAATPTSDYVSIQFNPYGWTEPIPMWSLGENRWLYTLYSPLQILGEVQYRFCRNDQCGYADDAISMGDASSPYVFNPTDQPQKFQNQVDQWAFWQPSTSPTSVLAAEIHPRRSPFVTGIELQPDYHPSMQSRYGVGTQSLKDIGTDWVVLTPSWTYTRINPLSIDPVPGSDPLWTDVVHGIEQIRAAGLQAAVFPIADPVLPLQEWWESAARDSAWWDGWFARYRTFLLHHADLAASTGAQALIIGGEGILPALPDGVLIDGSASGVPSDAGDRWAALIMDVRTHFQGSLLWAVPFREDMPALPEFSNLVDQVYLLWSPALSTGQNPSTADLESEMGRLLDSESFRRISDTGKPVFLAVAYPSIDGGSAGCTGGDISQWTILDKADRPAPGSVVDLQEQVDVYNAVFSAINGRENIAGVVARGMYFSAPLQDPSTSVYGKPAWDVLWYWFPQWVDAP
jgi:hypothetical protein